MSEEIDLTRSKWIPDNEGFLVTIKESLTENFSNANIDEELLSFNFTMEDLLNNERLKKFMDHLNNKFPE